MGGIMLENIHVVHFSPAGNTRKAALLLAQALGSRAVEQDLTLPQNKGCTFGPEDVVIVAGPVYGGRLPEIMVHRMAALQGNGALAVTLAVYGNRAYELSLIHISSRAFRSAGGRKAIWRLRSLNNAIPHGHR